MKRKQGFKRKIPLIGLWLVTDGRLRAGYRHRYEHGYVEGFAAGRDPVARDGADTAGSETLAFKPRRERASDVPEATLEHDALAETATA